MRKNKQKPKKMFFIYTKDFFNHLRSELHSERTIETYCQSLNAFRIYLYETYSKTVDQITIDFVTEEVIREFLSSVADSNSYLLGKHNYLKVDVHNPQFKVIVEIRDYGAYIHGPKIPGEGGLPVGTSGRALNMLSGGIDSPVAAYRMAKRGLALDHIHFASPPYTSERAKLKGSRKPSLKNAAFALKPSAICIGGSLPR